MADLFKDTESKGKDLFAGGKDLFAGAVAPEPISTTEQNINAVNSGIPVDSTPELKQDYDDNMSQWEQLGQSRFSPERLESFKNNPIGFLEASDFLETKDVVPLGGLAQGVESLQILNISKKLEKGEEVTEQQQEQFNSYIDKMTEINLRGFDVGGKIGYYGMQMPAFMTEFALTAGVGKIAQKATTTGIKKGAVKVAVGTAANIAARSTVMMPMNVSTYGNRRLNNFMSITDKGQVLTQEGKESPVKSALMSYGYTTASVGSEMAGGVILKGVSKVLSPLGVLKTPLTQAVNKLPMSVQKGLYQSYKKINVNSKISNAFSRVGYNGMLGELGEEELENVLAAGIGLVGGDLDLQGALEAVKGDNTDRLATAGIIGIMGGASVSFNTAVNLFTRKGSSPIEAKELASNMTETELDEFVNNEYPLPKSGYKFNEFESKRKEDLDVTSPQSIQGDLANIEIKNQQELDTPLVADEESGFNNGFMTKAEAVKEKAIDLKDRFVFEMVNDKRFLESLSPDIKQSIRQFYGIAGTIRQNLQVGIYEVVDGKNQIVGKSLKSITDDWNNAILEKEPSLDNRLNDQNEYLQARRMLEDLIPRADVEITDTQKTKAITDMARLNEKYGDKMEWFEEFSNELYENQQTILHKLVDSGVMSEESFKAITEANPHYISFNRIIEDGGFSGYSKKRKFTDAKPDIKKIKGGSDLEIGNFLKTVSINTGKMITIAERNRIATSVKDVLVGMGQTEKSKPLLKEKELDGKTVLKPSRQKPEGTMSVYENGERVFYSVDEKVLREVEQQDPNVNRFMAGLLSPLRVSAKVMRAGATGLNPEFWSRNFIRDTFMVNLQSKVNPNAKDAVQGIFTVLGQTDAYNEWEAAGGSFDSYMGQDPKEMDKNLEEIYKDLYGQHSKVHRYLRNPLRAIEDVGDVVEKANRLGVFQKALKKGLSEKEAVFESRDASLDFMVGGKTGRIINRYIPFFNAGIRGSAKLMSTIKTNPKAFMYHGITRMTLPTILYNYYMLYQAPDDEREEYLELPTWRRMLSWNVKIGDNWWSIPKPFAPGQLFATVPEMLMLKGYKGNKPEVENMGREIVMGMAGSLVPIQDISGVMPPLLKYSIESMTNYNFFTGRNIYPEWMDRLEPSERASKHTPESMKMLGEQFNVSPALINNALRGQFAGSARFFTDAADKVIKEVREFNGEKTSDKPIVPADIPLVRSMAVRTPSGYGTISASNFFDNWNTIQQKNATFNKKKGKDKKEYFEKNKRELTSYKLMKGFYNQMKSIRDIEDRIYTDKNMSSEDKVDKIKSLDKKIDTIVKKANKTYKNRLQKENK